MELIVSGLHRRFLDMRPAQPCAVYLLPAGCRCANAWLTSGEATVGELAEPFEMTQPAISEHLKVLERAGLISRGRAAQTRPCRLEASRLREVAQWVGTYRSLWEESFDRLDAFLQSTQQPPMEGKKNVRK
jgi:DNA-binding transcriptional ArsR family regulator